MSDGISYRILQHVADSRYVPLNARALAKELGLPDEDFAQFEKAVAEMIEQGQVLLSPQHAIMLPPPGRTMIGKFRRNERGFGFIVPESAVEHGDLFVPAGQTGGGMTGDLVEAKVIHQPTRAGTGRSPYVGRITRIIQRANKQFVGELQLQGKQWFVIVDGGTLPHPVLVRDVASRNLPQGSKVVIELLKYPDEHTTAEGVITEVLGEAGEPDVETAAVMRGFGLIEKFSEEVLAEARAAAATLESEVNSLGTPRNTSGRLDLTRDFIITIDPPDAKDYDDAISIQKLTDQSDGAVWELGVHIADVAHFVPVDGALDQEARKRGNSVYLPRKVIPMLPEILSNGVCSLQEGVPRLCKSAFMRYDAHGHVLSERFANTVIKSSKRLTYLEAQALIDGDLKEAIKHSKTEPKYPQPLNKTLRWMDELAKVIRQRRLEAGMIVLGLPEVELVYDESGRVVDAKPEDSSFTHTLIEMFMVEANEAAARLFDRLDIPMVRRIHPDPPSHDMRELKQFARVAGFNIPASPSRRELQALLDGVRGKPAQQAVHLAVLKTLSKAEYSPMRIGHFALASEHYTHFTSPIRRYPDLVVHRGLAAYFKHFPEHGQRLLPGGREKQQLARDMRADPRCPEEKFHVDMGRHCSSTERNAESAEHQLRTYLVLQLLAQHLGDDFDGTVTGVTGAGIFIQINQFLVDGFIRLNDLPSAPGDTWQLNRTTGALVAGRSGRTISIGHRFVVRIARVNPAARKLELAIVESTPHDSKRKQPPGAAKAHQFAQRLKRQRKADRRGKRRR